MTFLHHHRGILLLVTAVSTLLFQSQQVYAHPEYLLRHTTEQQDDETNDRSRTLVDSTTLQKQLIIPQIKTDIKALIAANPALAPKLVRLTFHDCVGGCNGCVDMTNPDNAGLNIPIDALQPVVSKYLNIISRADQWALAGLYAAELSSAVPGAGGQTNKAFPFPFLLAGRVDCDATTPPAKPCTNFQGQTVTCGPKTDNHNVAFPSPDLTTDQLLTFMANTFQFNTQETVAIMGAHTLGKALRQNSGFPGQGGWDNNELRLDNNYYAGIVGPPNATGTAPNWNLVKVDNTDLSNIPDRYFWLRPGAGGGGNRNLQQIPVIVNGALQGNPDFMLSSDIALVRDFTGRIATDGAVACRFGANAQNACPFAKTISQASQYRVDNNLWLNDFRKAFTKMTLTGYNSALLAQLTESTAPTRTPTRTPKPTPAPNTRTPKPTATSASSTRRPTAKASSSGTRRPTRKTTAGSSTRKPT